MLGIILFGLEIGHSDEPYTVVCSMTTVNYTKKVIYCGTQNNVLLPVYITTIIHIQNQNKVVVLLVAWLFTMPHVGRCSYQL
jgi:hypothetical protein